MKSKYFNIIIISVFSILFFSCDKIEEPYIKDEAVIWNGRKSIILDFTGHTCGNCPDAHKTIDELIEKFGDALVPVAVHSTYFAMPETEDTSKAFHYDFRTDFGDFWAGRDYGMGYLGEIYLPTGLINNLNPNALANTNTWANEIASVITTYPEYKIEITPSFSNTDSLAKADIKIITNIKNSKKLSILVFIIEDGIIQWQKNYKENPNNIKDYEHNHVLRASFNGNFGDKIKDNNTETIIGNIISKSYSLKIKKDWNINNCSIVAFIYDTETNEVLQAEITKILNE
ncbi:MAG: Omp28 family outer membrane lipoprotein [Bacteroidales bacterium]|jgi:thiol-disulfide isomerase/thioredoxin|nr:Omp28 family outer membrane lipoprotein [Bacteroidales bacterium]MDY0315806.1 Omp28 family outer membrane lipoprotein [Bacteroidales bacterium]NLB86202.1 Omp28 family outer membrane lipoprotein [Bacteroidales bacterium]